ncbi:MAG TPA: hypothetical protein VGD90_00110 [Sphingobacteriaceae bacterium]
MSQDPFAGKLFEMKLIEIYEKHSWLKHELSEQEFIKLFPINYKHNKPVELIKPAFDLDRDIFLEVLVAFKQSFG